jgi:hypothetical protein
LKELVERETGEADGLAFNASDFGGVRHGIELRLAESHVGRSRWIGGLLTLPPLAKVIADHRREPRKVPRAATGSRPQAPFIPQVPKAAQDLVLGGACRCIHHVHDVARL